MPLIVRFKDPANLSDQEIHHPLAGTNLLDFICDNFAPNFDGLDTVIILNGVEIVRTSEGKCADEMESALNIELDKNDEVRIITRPAGFDPITWAFIAVAALSIAVVLLMPDIPTSSYDTSTSPNNSLNAATNEFRRNQAIPEIFGSPLSYPDFVQPSHYEYVNNLKVLRELFCIGKGRYIVSAVRSGETLINDIPNSSYATFDTIGGQYPAASQRITVRETNEITNQSLIAPNSLSVYVEKIGMDFAQIGPDVQITFGDNVDFIADMGLEVGNYLLVELYADLIPPAGPPTDSLVLTGAYAISSINIGSLTLTLANATLSIPAGFTYISDSGHGTLQSSDAAGNLPTWIGWYSLSGNDNTEAWFHLVCPVGVQRAGGGVISITFEMQVQQIDANGTPIGAIVGQTQTITDSTSEAQYRTYKFQGLASGRYQARIRRITNEYGSNASERINLEQIVGVEYQAASDYRGSTLLWIERKQNNRQVGGAQSKINCDLIRRLPYYNRSTNQLELTNYVATRDFADAVAYTLIVGAKRNPATVNLAELYTVNDSLPLELRRFDYTFDDKNVGLRERITIMCNVARVIAYQSYQNWAFERIEAKPVHTMLFNRRNTIGQSRQSSPQFLPSDKNSISLTYVTQPDNVEKTIYRSLLGGVIVNQEGTFPEELTLIGCQTDSQAENRADYEIRRLLYQRDSVEFDAYYFGLDGRIGSRVRWVDMNDEDVFDGEIVDIFGNEYLTSEPIYFEVGKTYYVQCTDQDGNVSALAQCFPLAYTEKGFSAAIVGAYTASNGDFELGSKYMIAPDDELRGTDYILKSISPSGENTVTVTLSEYNDKLFEND